MDTEKKLVHKEERKNIEKAEPIHDRQVFTPATDIFEKGETIYVQCDMPGVDESNIDIALENNVLIITGHQDPEGVDDMELLHQGYTSGIYQRSFTITDGIDKNGIKAKLKDGVLRIELPKSESLKPKKINIATE